MDKTPSAKFTSRFSWGKPLFEEKTKQAIVLNCPNQSLRLINKMVNAFSMFLASQDALEVMRVTDSLSHSLTE